MSDTPRIYVADLAAYNGGRLHGTWIDLDGLDTDEVFAAINEMLLPGHEEFAIHDYEGFGGYGLSEYESIARVVELAAAIGEHGADVVGAFVSNDSSADLDGIGESYCGTFRTVADYVEEFYYDVYPEKDLGPLASYIDWERVARDWEYNGDIWTTEGGDGVLVFRNY